MVAVSEGSWWSISGETPGERMRNGWLQLLVLAAVVWIGTLVVYNAVSFVLDPITATAVLLVGGLFVGFKLRDWLVEGQGREERETEPADQ